MEIHVVSYTDRSILLGYHVNGFCTVGPGLKGYGMGFLSDAGGFEFAFLAGAFADKLLMRNRSAFHCNAFSGMRKSFPICLLPFLFFLQ